MGRPRRWDTEARYENSRVQWSPHIKNLRENKNRLRMNNAILKVVVKLWPELVEYRQMLFAVAARYERELKTFSPRSAEKGREFPCTTDQDGGRHLTGWFPWDRAVLPEPGGSNSLGYGVRLGPAYEGTHYSPTMSAGE